MTNWRSIPLIALFAVNTVTAEDASVNSGIANTGTMSIEGDVTIEVNSGPVIDDLIAVLNIRGKKIIETINSGQYQGKELFLNKFTTLHRKHIQFLEQGKFVAAHEILGEIHRLSYEYELSRKLHWSYFCSRTRYIRGSIINGYVANDFVENSKKYALSKRENEANEKQRTSLCGPSYRMASIATFENIYRLIISSK